MSGEGFAGAGEAKALRALLAWLKTSGYRFVTITPASHRRVVSRPGRERAADAADAFGWSLPFSRELLPNDLFEALDGAGLLSPAHSGLYRSTVRVSSLGGDLYLHSAFPTDDDDAVFFGPDSYRFAALIKRELERRENPVGSVVDIGTGSGVGAIVAGHLRPAAHLAGTDVNEQALAFAEINAQTAGLRLELEKAEALDRLARQWDFIIANPPYMIDPDARAYRDGGDKLGADISLTMARDALRHLAPGGLFVLYTGTAIVRGHDGLHEELAKMAASARMTLAYGEIDPDVFGEELSSRVYREVDRIAVVSAIFERPI